MQILLNGEPVVTKARTLHELCASLGLAEAKIATARNGDFIPASNRQTTMLAQADEIEIVSPRQGG